MIASCSAPAPQPFSQLQAAAMACSTAASSAQHRHLQVFRQCPSHHHRLPLSFLELSMLFSAPPLAMSPPACWAPVLYHFTRHLRFPDTPESSCHTGALLREGDQKALSVCYSLFGYFILEYFNLVHSKSCETGLDSHLTGR